jgi:DNA-binding MurR/RpiR family transcriptional regulator
MINSKLSLVARIHNVVGLSTSQRRIADCLLGRLNEAAFWGVEELASRSQSSVATVVRFAQKLGYTGFLEMRQALVALVKKQSRTGEQLLTAPSEAAATLVEVARRDLRNIEQTIGGVNEQFLQSVVEMLEQARYRVVIGDGVSALMSSHLAYLLTQAGRPAIQGIEADFPTQVANLGPEDLLVAISFSPYSRETVEATAFARRRNLKIIAFTDRLKSPLARYADFTLTVHGANLLHSHSLAAFTVLAQAIATSIASRDREMALKRLREAERVARPKFVDD